MSHVQALETIGKVQEINGIFCLLINKLPLITVELVTSDDNQQEWNFKIIFENLWKWTEINTLVSREEQIRKDTTSKSKAVDKDSLRFL